MSWDSDFAKQFKSRDNESKFGAVVGTVVSITPLKATIYAGKILTTPTVCQTLKDRIIAGNQLNIGDSILVMVSDNNQVYFAIDKL